MENLMKGVFTLFIHLFVRSNYIVLKLKCILRYMVFV